MSELKIGQTAPDFSLPDAFGKTVKLSDFRGQKVVLYFYPKDQTSGCTIEACEFTDLLSEFTKKKVAVLGVSVDDETSHQQFIQKKNLKVRLLSDTSKTVVERYGVWKQKSMYGKSFMGTVRTTFLINETGKIQRVWNNVTALGHAKEVLGALK